MVQSTKELKGILLAQRRNIKITFSFERLYNNLMANEGWMSDLHEADAIIVSTHSQGSIVSTHLLHRLIQDNHITTSRNHDSIMSFGSGAETFPSAIGMPETIPRKKVQRVCCMGLCGIHLGPLKYLSSSTLVQPYIQVSGFLSLIIEP